MATFSSVGGVAAGDMGTLAEATNVANTESSDIPLSTDHVYIVDKSTSSSQLSTRSDSFETKASAAPKNQRMASLSPESKGKRRRESSRRGAADTDDTQSNLTGSRSSKKETKRSGAHSLENDDSPFGTVTEVAEPSHSPPEIIFLAHPDHRQRKGSSSAPNVASSPLSPDPSSPGSSPRSAASDSSFLGSSQLSRKSSSKSSTLPDNVGTVSSYHSRGKLIQFFGESNVLLDANRIGWAPQPAHVNPHKLRKRFGESVPLDALSTQDTSDANVQSSLGSGQHGSRSSSSAGGDEPLEIEVDSDEEARKKEAKQQKSALKIGRFFGDRSAKRGDSPKVSKKSKSRFANGSGSKERITREENEILAKPPASPSTQPANVDPLKLNRFFGERVDIVKSAELPPRGARSPRVSPSSLASSQITVVSSSASSSLLDEELSALSRGKSPRGSSRDASLCESGPVSPLALASAIASVTASLNELQLASQRSAYDADSSSDLASAEGDEQDTQPKSARSPTGGKHSSKISRKASSRRLMHSTNPSTSSIPHSPPSARLNASTANGSDLKTSSSGLPINGTSSAWSSTDLSPPPYSTSNAQARPSKRSASLFDLIPSSVSRSFMSAPPSPSTHQLDGEVDLSEFSGPALSPPQATRLEHRLEPGLLSPGRPTIRTSHSARSVLQSRRTPVALIDLSNVQPTSGVSSPTSAHTAGSSLHSAGSSPRTHSVAPLSATRSAVRANVERSRSSTLAHSGSQHGSQLSVNGPSVSRKSSGNSLLVQLTRIEDMDPFDEGYEQHHLGGDLVAGASIEGSPSTAGAFIGSPVDAGLSPRGSNIIRRPSREIKPHTSPPATGISQFLADSAPPPAQLIPERHHSPPSRRRHHSNQTSPTSRPTVEEMPNIHTPPSFRKSPTSTSTINEVESENSVGTTDNEIWTEQVRESQRNRKLRKLFGETVSHDTVSMAPQSETINWKKLNKKLGFDGSAAENSDKDQI